MNYQFKKFKVEFLSDQQTCIRLVQFVKWRLMHLPFLAWLKPDKRSVKLFMLWGVRDV